jgi:hypothetical protein
MARESKGKAGGRRRAEEGRREKKKGRGKRRLTGGTHLSAPLKRKGEGE